MANATTADVPIEMEGRGVYHAKGHLPTGELVLWAQTDDSEIIGYRVCDPANYWDTVDDLEAALNAAERTEAA